VISAIAAAATPGRRQSKRGRPTYFTDNCRRRMTWQRAAGKRPRISVIPAQTALTPCALAARPSMATV